jgi:hypothetical protein
VAAPYGPTITLLRGFTVVRDGWYDLSYRRRTTPQPNTNGFGQPDNGSDGNELVQSNEFYLHLADHGNLSYATGILSSVYTLTWVGLEKPPEASTDTTPADTNTEAL